MLLTPWGYSVDADAMPDLITREQFDLMTDGRYASDGRVDEAIKAASAAIRNHCGWHVAPALTCEYVTDGAPGDLWLPTSALLTVESVTFGGAAQTVKGYNRLGRVRTDRPQPRGLGNVTATYTAGYDAAATADLADLIKGRVLAIVALGSYGIAQESVGNASVSYSGSALSDAGGYYLPESVRGALMPYRLVRSHAA